MFPVASSALSDAVASMLERAQDVVWIVLEAAPTDRPVTREEWAKIEVVVYGHIFNQTMGRLSPETRLTIWDTIDNDFREQLRMWIDSCRRDPSIDLRLTG